MEELQNVGQPAPSAPSQNSLSKIKKATETTVDDLKSSIISSNPSVQKPIKRKILQKSNKPLPTFFEKEIANSREQEGQKQLGAMNDHQSSKLKNENELNIKYLLSQLGAEPDKTPNLHKFIDEIDNKDTEKLSNLEKLLKNFQDKSWDNEQIELFFENSQEINYFMNDFKTNFEILIKIDPKNGYLLPKWLAHLDKNPDFLEKFNENRFNDDQEFNNNQALAAFFSEEGISTEHYDAIIKNAREMHIRNTRAIDFFKKLTLDELKFLSILHVEDASPEVAEHYIVRKEGFAQQLYKGTDQNTYGIAMHKSVKQASACIHEFNWKFDKLVKFHAMQRREIGCRAGRFHSDAIGIEKTSNCETSCYTEYAELTIDFHQKWESIKENGDQKNLRNSQEEDIIDEDNEFLSLDYPLQFVSEINGEKLILTSVGFKKGYKIGEEVKLGNCAVILHTRPTNAKKVMNYVEELYNAALEESDPEKLTEQLGEIFWWICQAKPWNLGDPSIAELLIRTVWDSKGLESPPWNVGVIPWVKASMEPDVKEFAKNFKNLFEWKKNK